MRRQGLQPSGNQVRMIEGQQLDRSSGSIVFRVSCARISVRAKSQPPFARSGERRDEIGVGNVSIAFVSRSEAGLRVAGPRSAEQEVFIVEFSLGML